MATATTPSAATIGEFGFFPCDGTCYVVSGLPMDGCAMGGFSSAASTSFFSKSDGDSGRVDLFFRSLAVWPATVDSFSSPLLHKLAADGWILRHHQALESLVKIGGGTNPYLHAGSGGGGGGSHRLPGVEVPLPFAAGHGRRWLGGGDGFGRRRSAFSQVCSPPLWGMGRTGCIGRG